MTIMVESSRTFLFTEYARSISGVIHTQGTDPAVWKKLPVIAPLPPPPVSDLVTCVFVEDDTKDYHCSRTDSRRILLPRVCLPV